MLRKVSVFGIILVCIFSAFSRIRTKYGEILCISPYSVRMWENEGKMRTRITPNTETFYAGIAFKKMVVSICSFKKQSPKLFYKQSVPKSFTKFTGKCLHLILPNFNDFFLKREVVNAKPDNYCKLRLCTGRSYKYLLINIYISEC